MLLATWLVTNERGLPEGYAPIPHSALLAAQVALLAIYLSSTIVRTLLRGFTFTWFETAQCALAFAHQRRRRIAAHQPRSARGARAGGARAGVRGGLLPGLLPDARSRGRTHGRNFHTYSTFGILLAIAGSRILLSGAAAAVAWSVLAVAAIWVGGHFPAPDAARSTACIFLLLALGASSALEQAAGLLLGSRTWPGGAPWAIWSGALTATLCYAIGTRHVAR